MTQVFGSVLLARGMTARLHLVRWAEFILFALMIIPAVQQMGVSGAALTLLAVYVIGTLLMLASVSKDLAIPASRLLHIMVTGLMPAGVSILVVYFVSIWSSGLWGIAYIRELGLVTIYLLIFIAMLQLTQRDFIALLRKRLRLEKNV